MKKVLVPILIFLMVFSICMPASANNVLGSAIYTDIVTYINHYPIPSYNFKGDTLIAVEALLYYGFDTWWNEYTNTVYFARNKNKNDIDALVTFKPISKKIGKKQFTVTTTDVKVVSGYCNFTTFGGISGSTLINVKDLCCIDDVSVTWVPEVKAIKIWIEDGLEMRESPFVVREFDEDMLVYNKCNYYDTDVSCYWQWITDPTMFILSFTKIDELSGNYCDCLYGTLEITDVIDANGKSRMKPYSKLTNRSKGYGGLTVYPYFYSFTDFHLAHTIIIKSNDLLPHTAGDPGGLVKFRYSCICGAGDCEDTIRVDCLPHQI